VLGILVLAAALRLYHLGSAPVALNQDEAVNGYDAYSLAYTARDHHGHFLPPMLQAFNDWTSPGLTYLTVPFVRVLGLDETTIRLPGAIAGALSPLLVYLILRRLRATREASLFGALLLCVSSWHVSLSRWAIPPTITPLLTYLCMFFLIRLLADEARERRWAIAVGAVSGVTAYTYAAEKLAIPLLLACSLGAVVLHRWRQRSSHARGVWAAALIACVFAVVVLPLAVEQVRGGERRNWHFERMSLLRQSSTPVADGVQRHVEYFSPSFFFGAGDPDPLQHVPNHAAVPVVAAPFLVLGAVSCLWWRRRQDSPGAPQLAPAAGLWLLALALVAPIPGALTVERMHTNRALHLLILTPVLAGLGFDLAVRWASPRWRTVVVSCVAAAALAEGCVFARFYFGDYREQTKEACQYGLRQAFHLARVHRPSCRSVLVDRRINQPYIYYLFFSAYPPDRLDSAAINRHGEDLNWLWVPEIPPYSFAELRPDDLGAAVPVGTVRDRSREWYRLWQRPDDGRCILQRGD
jgi:4-amino-4-deoxy-L-arabinose transferase-like glycosyltransferase